MRSYRYASHAAVLAIAFAVSGYTAVDLGAWPLNRPGTLSAAAASDGTRLGDVAVGRDSMIIKPVSLPAAALPDRKPIRYTAIAGDTLASIATAFGVPIRDVIWSNPGLKLPLKAGTQLAIPPLPGVVVVVKPGETAEALASRYGADPSIVLGFNDLNAAQLKPGLALVIPVDAETSPNLGNGLPADPIRPGVLVCPILGAAIIQKFGPTSFALEPAYGGYAHFHTGVDVLADYGTPIDAAAGGRVTAAGTADYFGIRVEVTDSYGLVEIYAHMSDVSVSVGQEVQQGQLLGHVGSTGLSIGAHLHLQLEVGGAPTDPGPLAGC